MKRSVSLQSSIQVAKGKLFLMTYVLLLAYICLVASSSAYAIENSDFIAASKAADDYIIHTTNLDNDDLLSAVSSYYNGVGADVGDTADWGFGGMYSFGGAQEGTVGVTVSSSVTGGAGSYEWSFNDATVLDGFTDVIFVVKQPTGSVVFYFPSLAAASGTFNTDALFASDVYSFFSVYVRGDGDKGTSTAFLGSSIPSSGGGGGGAPVGGAGSASITVPELDASSSLLVLSFLLTLLAISWERRPAKQLP